MAAAAAQSRQVRRALGTSSERVRDSVMRRTWRVASSRKRRRKPSISAGLKDKPAGRQCGRGGGLTATSRGGISTVTGGGGGLAGAGGGGIRSEEHTSELH